jgi:hypothetical protein
MEKKRNKRSLRVALVLSAVVAGTALIGWGGLAVWNSYTQNAGNAFAAGTLQHNNQANGATSNCLSTATITSCSVIVSGSGLASNWSGTTGTVKITNTGSLTSNFAVLMPAAPSGSLCSDLTLGVTDDEATPATVYPATALSSQMASTAVKDSAGNTSWPTYSSGSAPGAAGTNTFTFAVSPGPAYANDNNAPGESCTFAVEFDQSA